MNPPSASGRGRAAAQSTAAVALRARILDQLAAADVKLAATLPDDWVSPLIEDIDADDRFIHVPAARETELMGICAGAFFAGSNAVTVMGLAGVLAAVHELATLNLMHGIPLLILTSLRGDIGDQQVYQVVQGQVGIPVIEALGLPHRTVARDEDIDQIAPAMSYTRLTKKPVLLMFTREMLR